MITGETAQVVEPLDNRALVFVLIGASAVGKSVIAEQLLRAGVADVTPTWTTRLPDRKGESAVMHDHVFVSDEQFNAQDQTGGFLQKQPFYNVRYGVLIPERPPTGQEALLVLKAPFMRDFIAAFPNTRVYQIEAPKHLLHDRMRSRGQSAHDIANRLRMYEPETIAGRLFAHSVFRNDSSLDRVVKQVITQMHEDRAIYLTDNPERST